MYFSKNKITSAKGFILLGLLFALSACSQEGSLTSQLRDFDPYNYTVQSGDTLYSIAWRYDVDYRDIARWNEIKAPYLILPTQRLKMRGPIIEPEGKTYLFAPSEAAAEDNREENTVDYSVPGNIPPAPPTNYPEQAPPVSTASSKKAPVYHHRKPNKSASNKIIRPTEESRSEITPVSSNTKTDWLWPVKGKVISTFSANDHDRKGIDIAGRENDKVQAAADGTVVYSGAGLISYGNLVIVKHNDRYLSAYAYNERLLVKEGVSVRRGQNIAIIGNNANVTNILHFEIRKDGKPVNPLVYLPKPE